jgi:hypothetical protein
LKTERDDRRRSSLIDALIKSFLHVLLKSRRALWIRPESVELNLNRGHGDNPLRTGGIVGNYAIQNGL